MIRLLIPFGIIFCISCSGNTENSSQDLDNASSEGASHEVILDNEKVKVVEYQSQPKYDVCGFGQHSHPEHLTVFLTDANVTVTTPEGKTSTSHISAGTSIWFPAETHTVINNGDSRVRLQLVLVK